MAAALAHYKGSEVVVFALPRGGAPVADPIATSLHAPLDLVLVRKIGVPYQPELAMGAIADGGHMIIARNEDVIDAVGVTQAEFDVICERESKEIERRRQLYLGHRSRPEVERRVAIVVDDGVATGATTRAALRAVRARRPNKLVLAVPVGPTDTIEDMRKEADEVVCLEAHRVFGAIGFFYSDFTQTTDQEVIEILERHAAEKDGAGSRS